VVLAAGEGTRMRSATPKVLHRIAGRTLIDHVIALATTVTGRAPIVVVNPAQSQVRQAIAPNADVVEQTRPCGTGDALRSVPADMREPGTVLVLNGDLPLLRAGTVRRLLVSHLRANAACTLLTVIPPNPKGLGRIVRNSEGIIERIVEERDLSDTGYGLPECNAGVYAFAGGKLWPALDRLTNDNAQGEFYLTDVIELIEGTVKGVQTGDMTETLGINDRVQLAQANAEVRKRVAGEHMLAGVTIEDPDATYIDAGVRIGTDTVIGPMSVLTGSTVIGDNCRIGPSAHLHDAQVGSRVHIGASFLEDCRLGDDVHIGPYNRIRPNTDLGPGVKIGTHAEVKNSTVGAGSHINHHSCVLDTDMGRNVNVGAGTITVNYDGERKHRTTIGDRAFIGSGSELVAPLTVGADAFVGAGSTITADVEPGALAVERAALRTLPGWVERRRRHEPGGKA
jgi:bifunctional UDP-N-acetylglucosamine pyrophosphorylase/glucosamine-1-phosphate N-acetyltransferase